MPVDMTPRRGLDRRTRGALQCCSISTSPGNGGRTPTCGLSRHTRRATSRAEGLLRGAEHPAAARIGLLEAKPPETSSRSSELIPCLLGVDAAASSFWVQPVMG